MSGRVLKDYDWNSFGKEAREHARKCGGLKASAALLRMPYIRLRRIAGGQEPKASDFLRILEWMKGRVLWP